MSGEHQIERLLTKVDEDGNGEPVATRLEKQATQDKKSLSLKVEAREDWEAQLELMKVDAERLDRTLEDGTVLSKSSPRCTRTWQPI
jgi:hypothetical protein